MSRLLEIVTGRVEPDITVLSLAGKIVAGPESRGLETLVEDLLRKNGEKIILDLLRVDYIDSTGMGSLAACLTKVARAGGALRLVAAGGKVRDLFKVTRLDSILAFYPTVLAASENFTGSAPGQERTL